MDITVRNYAIAAIIVLASLGTTSPGNCWIQSNQESTADEGQSVASHIPTAAADVARPLAVIDRTDIELSGMKNVWDLLLSRKDYNDFGLHRPFVFGGDRVAVLVNGRRVSDSTFDIEALPISAVERVEILSNSAAALHGGHAIGGAVNIMLKRKLEGVEVQTGADLPTGVGGDTGHGSALWGGSLGGGHVVIGVDVFQRQEVRDADRDYSRASWTPGGPFAAAGGVSVGGNTVFIPIDGGLVARPLGVCDESVYTGVLTEPYGISGAGCGFAWAGTAWNLERYERQSLFLNLDQPLGEDVDMYVDARVARGNSAFRYAPSVGTFSFLPSDALKQQLPQVPEIDTPLRVAHRFLGHGNRDWRTDIEEYDLTLGVQGRISGGGIGYDAHLRYYRHDTIVDGDTFVSESAIRGVIDERRYDLENPLSRDPVHLLAVRETGLRLIRDQVTDHKTARASFDGAAFTLSGGNVRWAAGAEVAYEDRRDVYDYLDIFNGSHDAGDVLGSGGNTFSGERRRWSAFTEVSMPLHGDWDLDLAGRRDDYNDVGATFSHQVASRYRLNEALAFRGSWSEGSKVPSLRALHTRAALDYPQICDTRSLTGGIEDCDEYQVERVSSGNPNLKPDKAESFSLGAVTSLGPFSLSVDGFRIGLSGAPAELSAQSIIDLEAEGLLPSGAAVIREGDLAVRIVSPLVNSGETDVEGLDLRARVDWKADPTDMAIDVRWSRVTRYEKRVADEMQPGDYPRNRVHASFRASRYGITAKWSVHAVSGYWNERATGRYKAWMGHDITLRWSDAFGLMGIDLSAGILNAGDRGPSTDPTVPGSEGADARLDSIRGRTIFMSARTSF